MSALSPLTLTFFKRRWLTDVVDLLLETLDDPEGPLAFDDVDLDNDFLELLRVTSPTALSALALEVLSERGPLPETPGLASLQPEMEGPAAEAFLRLLAVNLAFRLRTDELLEALVAFCAEAPPPALRAEDLGSLLARCRPPSRIQRLLDRLPEPLRAEAQAAATCAPVDARGARLHVQASADALERALDRAMRPLERTGWTQGVGRMTRRRFLAHKQRGGWFTLLEEGDAPTTELARTLAKESGVRLVAWASFAAPANSLAAQLGVASPEGDADLLVLDGTRAITDRAALMAALGGEVTAPEVLGELRALGITDLDPEHSRGVPYLRWADAAGLDFKKKSIRSFCYV